MNKPRFRIKLKDIHQQSGMTAYAVAKQLGLNESTVRKYVTEDVLAEFLPNHVLMLTDFYGVDWRDPAVIEIIEDEEDTKQVKTINPDDERRGLLVASA